MKRLVLCTFTQNVSKNNFGLKFVQTNFSVFKIDNFKNTKIIFGAVRALDGILKVSHQILKFSAICRAWQSRQIKLRFHQSFHHEEKICDEKDLFCVPYTERFQKNNFGLKFVQTNFSVFKIDNFKNTKIIFGAVRALDGILKVSHQILVFCYLSSLAKSTNKTKISLVFFIMKKKICDEKRLVLCTLLTQNVSKIILV